MFALAKKCQGLAGTTNANNAAIQQVIPALREGEKCQEHLRKQVEGIKEFLEQSVRTIETSYHALETNCVAAINKMADHHKEQHTTHGVCITSLQDDRDRLDETLMNTHHMAYTGAYT
jgi:hypothetical protein